MYMIPEGSPHCTNFTMVDVLSVSCDPTSSYSRNEGKLSQVTSGNA
jgi:hypothetical protein